ncbi:MAG: pantoate--beta-alanine ligase [Desulfobacteraceae bacterium]|nr:MAG: pantoate--beta-alanine ligase [Desulfobacteraceae bacterium]
MEIIKSIKEMRLWSDGCRRRGQTIVLVPTMGYLHDGHLSLMREGRRHGDKVVVSIFVNPTQFGPGEDLSTYPRDLERDFNLAKDAGADIIFTPNAWDVYPQGFDTFINQEKLPDHLCGLSRPGHFKGVMTVVAKLFHMVAPQVAIFGEKDFQQLAIIRRMVTDLNFDIQIISHPTVRESDGLAMSSRNSKLSSEQRKSALSLNLALQNAQKLLNEGETRSDRLIQTATDLILSYPGTSVDYIHICDPDSLENVSTITGPAVMALAIKVGPVRLIDNMILTT